MNRSRLRGLLIIFFAAGLVGLVGCRQTSMPISTGPTETNVGESTPVVVLETVQQPNPTDTPSPTDTASPTDAPPPTNTPQLEPTVTPLQPTLTPTTGPMCTVLTELNLRFGPGTAYRPPIRALPAGFQLVPVGFNPVGTPGGPWVQVRDETRNEVGWVSAGQQFVSCNIELNSLPQVAVSPPSPPPPPRVTNSVPDGSCSGDWECELDFNPVYLFRIIVYDVIFFENPKDGDGIESVFFTVFNSEGEDVYQRNATSSPFCIFGGSGSTCNPWIIEDHFHRWTAGGPPAASGEYILQVSVEGVDFETGNWTIQLNLQFP
jgi:hypothetical protein